MDAHFKPLFPNLSDVAAKKTSNPNPIYNCIAWAFKDETRHWWPNLRRSYWPMDATQMTAMQAFEAWFAADGWTETNSAAVEAGHEKIALYALNGQPTHAARQLDTGVWSSKLGQSIDLSHAISDLDGPKYGAVHKIFRKPT